MKRARFLVHGSMKEKTVKRFHELGALQVTDFREKLSKDQWKNLLIAHPASSDVRRITTQMMSVNRMLDVFSMVVPEIEESFFKMLFAPAPPEKISVSDISGEKLFEEVKMASESAEALISDPLERLENMENEKSELSMHSEVLKKITSLDFSVEVLGEGPFVNAVMGIAGKKDFSQLKAEIEEVSGGICFFAETAVSDTDSCILVISLLKDEDEVLSLLRKWDVERINPGSLKGTPTSVIAGIDGRIVEINAEQEKCRQAIGKAAEKWRSKLKGLRELLFIERDRAEIYSNFAKTETAFVIEGWVTEKKADFVVSEIKRCCDGLVFSEISEPDEPVEKLPVKLDNPGLLKHFELLVKLYASPKYDEIDPTVLIFPTFLFFFGLMITDAMYGLICLVLGISILRGAGKYYSLYKSAGMLLTLGGVSTIVLGSMTGGWFGNFGAEYLGLEFLNSLVVINPMVDVSNFLLFAIGVGVLHLNVGIVMGIIKNVRRNDTPSALRHVWIFFLEIALICYYFEAMTPALIFVVPAALMLLYAEKGMFLFGVTGLLGDSLSYARLMALGLVSFGLAVAINALAKMTWGIEYVGWLVSILIFIFGHLFSFVLNLMGAFAHGIRLHFVEFFGKFYSGGGDDFEPFSIKRDITELKQ
jgi:V/A-type H+-transporting ATPase subunit I